jgi:glutathione synthase/RimK-type ligase-like ATP-grasp enzyme
MQPNVKKPNILIISSTTDLTADLVVLELKKLGLSFYRLNVDSFPDKLQINISTLSLVSLNDLSRVRTISLEKVSCVYFRPHNQPTPDPEIKNKKTKQFIIEQSELLIEWLEDALSQAYWINSPRQMRLSRSKILQLKIAEKIGFKTPKTIVSNNPNDIAYFLEMNGPLAMKILQSTIASRALDGFIFTQKILTLNNAQLDSTKYSPTIYQEYIEKDFELRLTVIGTKIISIKIESQQMNDTQIDWRSYEFNNPPKHVKMNIPTAIKKKLVKMNRILGIDYGAYDFIVDKCGNYIFLEVNANGQWGWLQELTKEPISKTLAKFIYEKSKTDQN